VLAIGLACVGTLLVWLAARGMAGQDPRDLQDFVEYWAAGRLNARGQNPYDARLMYEMEHSISPGLTDEIMMWNPPWVLTLAMPFGLLPAQVGHLLWVAIQLSAVLFAADVLWRFYGGALDRRWVGWLVALGFAPTFFLVRMGQISGLVLLGVVAFLHLGRRGRWGWAGAALVFAAIKPQIIFLFGLGVLFWALDRRNWRLLAGAAVTTLVLLAVPVACNPVVLGQYVDAMAHRPPQMLSPTLGTLLRLAFGVENFRLQFVPTALGVCWLVAYWRARRHDWDWAEQTPVLLLASFLTASYGAWPFDIVILLIPIVQASVWLVHERRSAAGFALTAYLGFDVMALLMMNVRYTQFYWYAWMTPLVFYVYWALGRQRRAVVDARAREPATVGA
jgi:hypothetical protein